MGIYGAINMSYLQQNLTADEFKMLEDVLSKIENALLCHKEVLRRYSGIKSNIKKIEKKMALLAEELTEDHSPLMWIPYEIEKIERKYPGIEKAIKNHMQSMAAIKMSLKNGFSPNYKHYSSTLQTLNMHVYICDAANHKAEDDMRITKRYFKNISRHMEWAVKFIKMRRYKRMKAENQNPENQ
jgi:hypothetical protein